VRSPGYYWWALRRDWRRGWRASWAARRLAPRIWQWRAPDDRTEEIVPLHVLCGHEHAVLAAWMLASWHHYTGRRWRVIIHDDGTLGQEDIRQLTALSPSIRVLERAAADREIAPQLASRPACARYRSEHPLALKIFDVPLTTTAPRFLLIDTDVLFFSRPDSVLRWVDQPDDDSCWFNADVAEAATITPGEMEKTFGCALWPKVNSGLCLLPRRAIDLELCERALRDTTLRRGPAWRFEQTLFAIAASCHGRGGLLPPEYEVSLGAQAAPGCVARHYVGAVRDRFFGEGIWRLHQTLLSGRPARRG
jgi:hypothetical protein